MKTIYTDRIPGSVSEYFASEGFAPAGALLALRSDLRIDGSRGD